MWYIASEHQREHRHSSIVTAKVHMSDSEMLDVKTGAPPNPSISFCPPKFR